VRKVLKSNEPVGSLKRSACDHGPEAVQAKTCNVYGWISAGSVMHKSAMVDQCLTKRRMPLRCDFVICLTPASPGDKKIVRDDWRYS